MELVLTSTNTNPLLCAPIGVPELSQVQSIFGGTTEIQKEIIGHSLGL